MEIKEDKLKEVISHAKEYGFVFPSSEIYDGLAATYDYGQLGSELKNNIKAYWWKSMVQMNDNIVGIDSAIFMHPTIWKASGHVDAFNDPLIDNKDSKKRYRADVLLEDHIEKIRQKIDKEVEKGLKRFGDDFNETEFRETNPNVLRNKEKINEIEDRMKIPFGIAQIGKAFRNEIVARQFIFRMREFEQMEMQFFVRPGEEMKWYEYWKEARIKWHKALGLGDTNYRFHDHIKLAHYANAAADIEFNFPMGFKELEGIHSRTDFDLKQHEQFSGKKLQYFDPELNQNYVPYVVETSVGLDRMFLSILSASHKNETLEDGSERSVLSLPPALAPYKVAVMPLTKKDGLPEKAEEVLNLLKFDYNCQYDEKDSPGKRYRRQDAIGTPYCVMIDHQTMEDNTVTIRDRDTMLQDRVAISDLYRIIDDKVNMRTLLVG